MSEIQLSFQPEHSQTVGASDSSGLGPPRGYHSRHDVTNTAAVTLPFSTAFLQVVTQLTFPLHLNSFELHVYEILRVEDNNVIFVV